MIENNKREKLIIEINKKSFELKKIIHEMINLINYQ